MSPVFHHRPCTTPQDRLVPKAKQTEPNATENQFQFVFPATSHTHPTGSVTEQSAEPKPERSGTERQTSRGRQIENFQQRSAQFASDLAIFFRFSTFPFSQLTVRQLLLLFQTVFGKTRKHSVLPKEEVQLPASCGGISGSDTPQSFPVLANTHTYTHTAFTIGTDRQSYRGLLPNCG